MLSEPIFDELVRELAFDPRNVAPIPTRANRKHAHDIWAAKVWQNIKASEPKAPRRPRKKAAS